MVASYHIAQKFYMEFKNHKIKIHKLDRDLLYIREWNQSVQGNWFPRIGKLSSSATQVWPRIRLQKKTVLILFYYVV